jgi:hypothetical protein
LDACANCELLPTKEAKEKPADPLASFFGAVFDARARARISGSIDKSGVTTLQYEMVVIAEQMIEEFEREAAARARLAQEEHSELITQVLKALAGIR